MALATLLLRLDRIAGGRQPGVSISEDDRSHPRTRRAFTWIFWLLPVELVLGPGAVVIALLLAVNGEPVSLAVWMRTVVVVAMTATLFSFAWRAATGWRWASS
jgi:hypothetical protein